MKAALSTITSDDIACAAQACPRVFTVSSSRRAKRALIWLALIFFTIYAMWKMDFFDFPMLIAGFGKLGGAMSFMFPPASHGALGELLLAMLQTIAMAFLGTLLSTMASIPLGIPGGQKRPSPATVPFFTPGGLRCHSRHRRHLSGRSFSST